MATISRTVLTRRGYGIAKEQASASELCRAREDLTVTPRGFGPQKPSAYLVYRESKHRLYVPRHFGITSFGNALESRVTLGEAAATLTFRGELRPLQQKAADAFEATLGPKGDEPPSARYPHGGILSLFCGSGKTIVALYLIARIKRKTIIVVHKEFLMHQWHERIQQFLPNAKVGIIQQGKVDIKNKDIVLAMLQSLAIREYPSDVFTSFGMMVADECHHLSSKMFSRALPKIGTRVTLGLSATPTRADGLTKVFTWYLGDIVFRANRPRDTRVVPCVTRIRLDAKQAGYGEELVVRYTGRANTAGMINRMTADSNRTRFVAALARILAAPVERQLLVLSGRRQHLDDIHAAMLTMERDPEDPSISIGYYVGGMNQTLLKASEHCSVVLATYSMAAEGLDIKSLNTLLLATPMSNVTQASGRILRAMNPGTPPHIVDIVDDYSVFTRQAEKRRRIYRQQGFDRIQTVRVTVPATDWSRSASTILARAAHQPHPEPKGSTLF